MKKNIEQPKSGEMLIKGKPEKVLLLCAFEKYGVPSIIEIVESIQRFSQYPVTVLNMYEHRIPSNFLSLPAGYNLEAFDVIIVHNTVAYNVDNLRAIDEKLQTKIKNFKGLKVIMKQDEHHRFRETFESILNQKFDVLFTVAPNSEVKKIYPFPENYQIDIREMLTGYVNSEMRNWNYNEHRPIDIGYRGSIMPLSFGRLCYEKRKIGDDVKRLAANKGLSIDISSRWEDRIGGEQWTNFLRKSKCVLGVESGSGLFDLDGTLEARCKLIEEELGPFRLDEEYAENYLSRLADLDGKIKYYTVSPRHFEAIHAGAVQILFPGHYSGRMIAGRHYLELSKDYSNFHEILEKIKNTKFLKEMATTAFNEVLLNPINWIETFVSDLDEAIETGLVRKNLKRRIELRHNSESCKSILMIQFHKFGVDPRRDHWIPDFAPKDLLIHNIGVSDGEETIKIDNQRVIFDARLKSWSDDFFTRNSSLLGVGAPEIEILRTISEARNMTPTELAQQFGCSPTSNRLNDFLWYLDYILDRTYTLFDAAMRFRGSSAIIAVNLPSLLVGCILKRIFNIPLIYEALEFWPELDPEFEQFEIDFWERIEQVLLQYVDYSNTVSPGLAQLMTSKYGVAFNFVPNACPIKDGLVPKSVEDFSTTDQKIKFLYQGSYAPYRGLDKLILAFKEVDDRSVLFMRGPDNTFRNSLEALALNLGILNTKVFFKAPVSARDLITSARNDADIAVIPYIPYGANYNNCSPNKLGQYLAAALPILANKTSFVESVVQESRSGIVVNFDDPLALKEAVDSLSRNNKELSELSSNANQYFRKVFNWESKSSAYYEKLLNLTERITTTAFVFYEGKAKDNLFLFDHHGERDNNDDQIPRAIPKSKKIVFILWRALPEPIREFAKPQLVKLIRIAFPGLRAIVIAMDKYRQH